MYHQLIACAACTYHHVKEDNRKVRAVPQRVAQAQAI